MNTQVFYTNETTSADGSRRRLRVDQVIHHDCPINVGITAPAYG